MMVLPSSQLVPTIIFFHFLGNGLVFPVLSKQVLKLGGNHIILGALNSAVFICNFISKDVLVFFETDKKSILNISLYICFFCLVAMTFATSYAGLIALRLTYAFTTQTVNYAKEYITKTERRDDKIKICNLIDIMRVAGLTAGSVFGGIIYEGTKSFLINLYFGCTSALLTLVFLHLLPVDELNLSRIESQLFLYQRTCLEQLDNLRKTHYKGHWMTVFLRFFSVYVYMIFYSRFIFLLIYNYKVNSIIVGCVRGYYYVLTFGASCLVPFIKDFSEDQELLFENSLMISAFALIAICYAPSLFCYLVCFVPLVLTHSLVSSLFADDILKLKASNNLFHASETLCIIANIMAPITSGIMRHYVGGKILKVFTVIPIGLYGFVLNRIYWQRQRRRSQWIEFENLPRFSRVPNMSQEEIYSLEDIIGEENPNDDSQVDITTEKPLPKQRHKKNVVIAEDDEMAIAEDEEKDH